MSSARKPSRAGKTSDALNAPDGAPLSGPYSPGDDENPLRTPPSTTNTRKRSRRGTPRRGPSESRSTTQADDALADIRQKKRQRAAGPSRSASPATRVRHADARMMTGPEGEGDDVASRRSVRSREPLANSADDAAPPPPTRLRRSERQATQRASRRSQQQTTKNPVGGAEEDDNAHRSEAGQTGASRTYVLGELDLEPEPEPVRDVPDEQAELQKLSILPNRTLFLYPPQDAVPGRVPITSDDAARLTPGCYLNDNLVDFYIKYIEGVLAPQCLSAEEPVLFFSSFFYGNLRNQGYDGVRRWTKGANDLFSKRFVFVPVCVSLHWILIVVANLDRLCSCLDKGEWEGEPADQPTVLYLDSLGGAAQSRAFAAVIKSYLADEWLFRKEQQGDKDRVVAATRARAVRRSIASVVRLVKPRVPTQTNAFDCGLYLLRNVVAFVTNSDGFRDHCLDRQGARDHDAPAQIPLYDHSAVEDLRAEMNRQVAALTPAPMRAVLAQDRAERDARVKQHRDLRLSPKERASAAAPAALPQSEVGRAFQRVPAPAPARVPAGRPEAVLASTGQSEAEKAFERAMYFIQE